MSGSCPIGASVCRETARERDELSRWKAEALPVLDGLQELGKALGLPLGSRITGQEALAAVERLTRERDEARAEVKRVEALRRALDDPKGRRPEEGQPRPMPEFSPERARLLAERPAHPWTPPDGPTLHRLEDVAEEFGVDLTEGEK